MKTVFVILYLTIALNISGYYLFSNKMKIELKRIEGEMKINDEKSVKTLSRLLKIETTIAQKKFEVQQKNNQLYIKLLNNINTLHPQSLSYIKIDSLRKTLENRIVGQIIDKVDSIRISENYKSKFGVVGMVQLAQPTKFQIKNNWLWSRVFIKLSNDKSFMVFSSFEHFEDYSPKPILYDITVKQNGIILISFFNT